MTELHGKVEALAVKPESLPSSIVYEVEVKWEGLIGDKHFGPTMRAGSNQKLYPKGTEIRNVRQISIVSVEELKQIAQMLGLPAIEPSWVGANLALSGIPSLTQMPPGTRLYFENGVGIVVEGENMPCTTAGASLQAQFPEREGIASAFPKWALGKRGLIGWVERPGTIHIGEAVQVLLPQDIRN